MMKKKLLIIFIIIMLVSGCNHSKQENYSKDNTKNSYDENFIETNRENAKVWRYSELNELNGENKFSPTNPQKNVFVLVVNEASKFERRELDNTSGFELEQQSAPLIYFFKKLNFLQVISNPQESIMEQYNAILSDKNMENIPLEIATDPNKASIIIEYKVTYPNSVKYSSGKEEDENIVNVYSCQIEFNAFDAKSREHLGKVSFITEAKGNISVIQDYKTEMFMDVPTFYDKENATKMTGFLLPLVN